MSSIWRDVLGDVGTRLAYPRSTSGATVLPFATNGDTCHIITATGNTTITLSGGNVGQCQHMDIVVIPNGFTVTLPTSSGTMIWAGGSAPVLSTSQGSFVQIGAAGGLYYGGL